MGNNSKSEKYLGDRLAAILDKAKFVHHEAKDFVASTAIAENVFLEFLKYSNAKLAKHLQDSETETKKFFAFL